MKILIDARMYGLENAGVGRYVLNLISEIKNQKIRSKNLDITLLVRKKNFHEIKQEFGNTFKIVICDIPHYSLKEQLILPLQLIKLKPDLIHFPHFNIPVLYPGKFIVTIHDLIKHSSRGTETTTRGPWLYWLKYFGYRFIFNQAVKRAEKILVPSQSVKENLVEKYNLTNNKIMVTYEGVDKKFQKSNFKLQEVNKVLRKYKIRQPFLIYTGSLYPHKNVDRLVEAVIDLNNIYHLSIFLVVVCARNVFYERFRQKIKGMKGEEFVNLVGFVPDGELAVLYSRAEAFVFPSLMEGFGLPGLEAMAVGLPVLASRIPVFQEIYKDAALYFDPFCINELIDGVKQIQSDEKLRESLKVKGFNLVKKYSWEETAKQTITVYESFCL